MMHGKYYSLVDSGVARGGRCQIHISSSSSMWMLLASKDQYQTPGLGPRMPWAGSGPSQNF